MAQELQQCMNEVEEDAARRGVSMSITEKHQAVFELLQLKMKTKELLERPPVSMLTTSNLSSNISREDVLAAAAAANAVHSSTNTFNNIHTATFTINNNEASKQHDHTRSLMSDLL
jgi:hypothetical protein